MTREGNKLPWLDGYNGQTIDELLSLESTYRIDSLICAFEQALLQKNAQLEESEEERLILAVEDLEREVNNGGYAQFFENTGEYAATIVDSLKRIGCTNTAALTQRAIEALGSPNLTADGIKRAIAAKDPRRDATLNEYDNAYFKSPEPIAAQLFAFIKANKHHINLR